MSLYWWDVPNLQGRASISPECSVCSGAGAWSFPQHAAAPGYIPDTPCALLNASACLSATWAAELCFEGFTCISEKLPCGIEKEQLVINTVCWWVCLSGEKISHNFLSRTYGHTSDSCWQHKGNLRSELSQKCFFSYPSSSSERTASVGQWVACIAAAGSTLPILWMKTCVARPGLRFLVVEET